MLHVGPDGGKVYRPTAEAVMPFTVLAPVPHLSDAARVGPLGRSRDACGIEVAALIGLGIGAAFLTTLVDASLRIPGHHII